MIPHNCARYGWPRGWNAGSRAPTNAATGWLHRRPSPRQTKRLHPHGCGHRCARPPRGHCGAARAACPARVTARTAPHGGWLRSGSGGELSSPRQQHVEQPLTLAAAASGSSARHLGARALGIEIPLQPYPLLDRLDDGALHPLELSGLAVEVG